MLETYINEFIHLYCSSFLKITETEPRFFCSKKTETGTEIKYLEPHSSTLNSNSQALIFREYLKRCWPLFISILQEKTLNYEYMTTDFKLHVFFYHVHIHTRAVGQRSSVVMGNNSYSVAV